MRETVSFPNDTADEKESKKAKRLQAGDFAGMHFDRAKPANEGNGKNIRKEPGYQSETDYS